MNALDHMNTFHVLKYNDLKKRIMANPVANANRDEVISIMHQILAWANGSPEVFLHQLEAFASRLDYMDRAMNRLISPSEDVLKDLSVVTPSGMVKLDKTPPKRPILSRILIALRRILL